MRRLRRLAGITALIAGLAAPAVVMAMDHVPYDMAAVAAAKEGGQKIILGIWATWCGVCQAQIAVLDQLATDPRFDAITIFHIDFDTQKNVMRLVGAEVRSQMIAFDGTTEIGRLIDITDPAEIEAFLLTLVDH
jgi:thioredoxin